MPNVVTFEKLSIYDLPNHTNQQKISTYPKYSIVFINLQNKGIILNVVTFICVFKVSGNIRSKQIGNQNHLQIYSMA